ncbi:hypothetical protein R0135_10510 [Congregibacter variabilis]|uniref:Dioxygenase n=1 Tax=Congregibacter variabilis TaxID=3081200 RepID=A0ABZ0HY94_9GAMM|nr:hypothetical protein R0135_10510 [Congregibacter sp. IMCC43200]
MRSWQLSLDSTSRSGKQALRIGLFPSYDSHKPFEAQALLGAAGGYALHSYLDYANKRSGIAVLRAADLASGPVMTAEMDRVLPLGFHGCFLGA